MLCACPINKLIMNIHPIKAAIIVSLALGVFSLTAEAARPSINSLQQQINQLQAEVNQLDTHKSAKKVVVDSNGTVFGELFELTKIFVVNDGRISFVHVTNYTSSGIIEFRGSDVRFIEPDCNGDSYISPSEGGITIPLAGVGNGIIYAPDKFSSVINGPQELSVSNSTTPCRNNEVVPELNDLIQVYPILDLKDFTPPFTVIEVD